MSRIGSRRDIPAALRAAARQRQADPEFRIGGLRVYASPTGGRPSTVIVVPGDRDDASVAAQAEISTNLDAVAFALSLVDISVTHRVNPGALLPIPGIRELHQSVDGRLEVAAPLQDVVDELTTWVAAYVSRLATLRRGASLTPPSILDEEAS